MCSDFGNRNEADRRACLAAGAVPSLTDEGQELFSLGLDGVRGLDRLASMAFLATVNDKPVSADYLQQTT